MLCFSVKTINLNDMFVRINQNHQTNLHIIQKQTHYSNDIPPDSELKQRWMTEEDEAGLVARWKPTGLAVVVAIKDNYENELMNE